MNNKKVDIEKIVDYWITSSENDFRTMLHLYESKDYHWSLFIGHLVIEKLLKATVVKNISDHAPLTHDLRRLAKMSQLDVDDNYRSLLDTISTFNLNARYDDYSYSFYKKCTPEYTSQWISNIKSLRKWIKTKL